MWTSSLVTTWLVCITRFRGSLFDANLTQEVNMANNAEAYAQGMHNGYEETAFEGLLQSINVIAEKQIKVVINGGALNPGGLAVKVADLVSNHE